MTMRMEVRGMEELQKKTDDVSSKISDSGDLVKKAAYIIERQSKINATKRPGPNVKSGRLRSSIMTTMSSPQSARVAPSVNYGKFVEFGHRQHPGQYVHEIRRRLVANFSPAYPFMEPTIAQTKGEVGDICVSFGKGLEDTWNK